MAKCCGNHCLCGQQGRATVQHSRYQPEHLSPTMSLADGQSGRPMWANFRTWVLSTMLGNGDNSMYHGLQLTLRQQTAMDCFSLLAIPGRTPLMTASGNREFLIQNSYDPAAERGNGDQDIRNRFTMATTYPLPEKKGYWQMLSGWRANTIISAQDGEPLWFADYYDNISGTSEYNDRWDFSGDPKQIKVVRQYAASLFCRWKYGFLVRGRGQRTDDQPISASCRNMAVLPDRDI